MGLHIYTAGVAFQFIVILVFFFFARAFHHRVDDSKTIAQERKGINYTRLLYTLYVCLCLIMVRSPLNLLILSYLLPLLSPLPLLTVLHFIIPKKEVVLISTVPYPLPYNRVLRRSRELFFLRDCHPRMVRVFLRCRADVVRDFVLQCRASGACARPSPAGECGG